MISLGFLLEFTDPQRGSLEKNCGRIWGLSEECRETPGAWRVRFPGGRTGAMRSFSQVIDDLELKDLPLHGGDFTWARGPRNQRMARLDRFLISDEWKNYFGTVNHKILPKPLSDHFPILLTSGGSIVRGPLPFLF